MAFAISTIIGVAGLALGAGGLYMNVSNQQKASNAQSAAAQNQAEIGALQAQNVDVQKQQLALQTNQQQLQITTQKDVINQQAAADQLRVQAAELDSKRRTRDAIRQGIVASSTALVRATNQGAASPGSSVMAQASGDIAGQTGTNIAGVIQNLDFGRKLYAINKNISAIYLNAQDANSQFVSQSQGLQNQVLDTQKKIYALGGEASSNYAQAAIAQGNAAIGQGIMSLGGTIANNSGTLGKLTNYFTGSQTPIYSGASSTSNPTGLGSLY
jgi:hypothetical protein